MEPIPETRELLDLLKVGPDSDRLESWLYTRAQQVAALIPDCLGVSIALFGGEAVTFTFVITSDDLRLVDAAQFLDGGPCQESAHGDISLETDVLSEQRWHLFALAEAATGVQSSLSLPMRSDGSPSGSVNFSIASSLVRYLMSSRAPLSLKTHRRCRNGPSKRSI